MRKVIIGWLRGSVVRVLRGSLMVGILVSFLLAPGCGGGGGGEDDGGDTVGADATSEPQGEVLERVNIQLTSNMSGEVTTSDGASIKIPAWAIPTGQGGSVAMEFTIEHLDAKPGTLPAGQAAASDLYAFGPGHFTFAQNVELTLPVQGDPNPEDVRIWRITPQTLQPEQYSGTYDPDSKTISAQTCHLSDWFVTTGEPSEGTADGAFTVTNTSATNWLNICVTDCQSKDADHGCGASSTPISAAPTGTIGWSSTVNWYLHQGTYDLCVESVPAGTVSTPPGLPVHVLVTGLTLDEAWTYSNPVTTEISYGTLPSPIDGPCDCSPQASSVNEVFTNSNIGGVFNDPTAPTVFTLDKCYYISRYVTYHWNNGQGKTPGTIGLQSEGGQTYGPWQTFGTPGQGGAVDAYWNCYPNIVLPKGTYTMTDSDPSTWAQNSGTGGSGMGWLEGLEADCP